MLAVELKMTLPLLTAGSDVMLAVPKIGWSAVDEDWWQAGNAPIVRP